MISGKTVSNSEQLNHSCTCFCGIAAAFLFTKGVLDTESLLIKSQVVFSRIAKKGDDAHQKGCRDASHGQLN